jgi:hypothetical protein
MGVRKGKQAEPRSLPWRVHWWDFRRAHDWIGHHPAKGGRNTPTKRAKPPPRQSADFATREEAEAFVANLRASEDIVAEIRSMRELLPLEPETPPFPDVGFWPRQGRRMTGTEWPSLAALDGLARACAWGRGPGLAAIIIARQSRQTPTARDARSLGRTREGGANQLVS